jgi:phosphoribosylamine---glycine ligase
MAATGYPGRVEKGSEIRGVETAASLPGVEIFHAGTRRDGARLLADGGRVLNITARGATIAEAKTRAYAALAKIDWPGGFSRSDIGWRALG